MALPPSSKVLFNKQVNWCNTLQLQGEGLSSFCPLLVSSPHHYACSAFLWLPAEAMQVPTLQTVFCGDWKVLRMLNPKESKWWSLCLKERVGGRSVVFHIQQCNINITPKDSCAARTPWSAIVWHLWQLALRISSLLSFQSALDKKIKDTFPLCFVIRVLVGQKRKKGGRVCFYLQLVLKHIGNS